MPDMNKAFQVAELLLEIEPTPDMKFPIIIHHPFFQNDYIMNKNKEFFNILNEQQKFEEFKIDFCNEYLKTSKDLLELAVKVRAPYRIIFAELLYESGATTFKESANLIAKVWTTVENITKDKNITKAKILKYLCSADKEEFMEVEELEFYNALPDEVVIYRGCNNKKGLLGFSWTIDKEVAIFFANRFGARGHLYKAKIRKENIFAYISGEEEIVCNYKKIYDIEDITE